MSMIRASGSIARMTPFMAPMKWSFVPKSVVRVMIGVRATKSPVARAHISPDADSASNHESNLMGGEGQGTEVMAGKKVNRVPGNRSVTQVRVRSLDANLGPGHNE